jgi:hypothetical protein
MPVSGGGGGGGGASSFLTLTDTPDTYAGQAAKVARVNAGESALEFVAVAGTGDVVGPASATDNAVARYDTTSGKLLQDCLVLISDTGAVTGVDIITIGQSGLKILDSDESHALVINAGSNLTAERTLTITTGDADRTVTLSGNTTLTGTNTGDQTITLTGDVTGTGTGSFATTIASQAVTYAKIQNVSATDTLLGRFTAGSGVIEEVPCTAAGRAILDDANATAQRTTLGLGTAAVQNNSAFCQTANDLSDVASASTARTNLGLGTAATQASTVFCQVANNLSDIAVAATARTNLGLGTIATQAASNVTITGGAITVDNASLKVKDTDASHTLNLKPASNLSADRILNIATGDSDRTITLSGDTTLTGSNTGDQTITLTGNVTGSGTGSFAATIANDAVTYAKMQNVSATDKILGRSTAGSGDVEEIDCTAAGRAILDDANAAAQRTTLGLGTIATQADSNVTITGGSITGITDLAVADGGTGSSTASGARTNLGVVIGTDVQAFDATLTAFAAYNTNGLLTQTAADTFTGRTLIGPAAGISVSNGNGVSGNPTLALANDLSAIEALSTTDVFPVRTATDTWTTHTFRHPPAWQVYASTITWTGTTAPSGSTDHGYQWTQIGNCVFYQIYLTYGTAGSALTAVQMEKPSDMPNPVEWVSGANGSERIFAAHGYCSALETSNASNGAGAFRRNAGDTAYEFHVVFASVAARTAQIWGHYFTA